MIQIEYLADNLMYAETVAGWSYNEFTKGIKHDVSYEQVLERVQNCRKTELPIRLVAIQSGICVGTVAIVQNDLHCRDYTPWLASLYVDEPHRGKKIAQQLIERVKEIVREMGYDELYLRTEHVSNYYRRLGWQFVETCDDDYGLKPDVFKFTLN